MIPKIQVPVPKIIEIQPNSHFEDEEEGFDEFVSAESIKETPKVKDEIKIAGDLLGLFEPPSLKTTQVTSIIDAGFIKAGPSRLLDLLADGDDPFKELTEEH